jgi:hypothetical protein
MPRPVTLDPLLVTVAFQAWLTACPLAKVQVTVQPLMAWLPAVTRTSAWKPPCHCPPIVYVAVQAPVPGAGELGGGLDGGGELGGGELGGGELGELGGGLVVPL